MQATGTPLLGLFATLAVALGGCTSTDARLDAMEQTVSQRLAQPAVPDGKPAAAVSFGDPKAALRQAVERNGAYRAARATEAEAFAGIAAAGSARRPQLTGSALAGTVREGSPSNRNLTGASADVMLSQLVFDGGAARATLDQATAGAIAARAAAHETGNTVALDAYRAWADLWVAQQQMAQLQARSGNLATIVGQLDRMTQSGMIDTAMRDAARVAQLDIRTEESRLRGELVGAEAAFLRYFGTVPASVPRPVQLLTAAERDKAIAAWESSPALRRAAAELVAAEAGVKVARAALSPTVALSAGVASPIDENDTTDTTVGFQLRYTFNDGGKRRAQIAAADARREALDAGLADARDAARALVAASVAQLAALDGSSGLIDEKVAATATQARTSEAQIVTGQSTPKALMDAQIADYRATEQQLRLTADRLILEAEIAAGTGALLARLGLDR